MELMSALLLYAFAATAFHQGLGIKTRPYSDIKLNTSLMLNPSGVLRKKILLNFNDLPPLISNSELQVLYKDPTCTYCTDCMRMAIKAHLMETKARLHQSNGLYYEVLKENFQKVHHHSKRSIHSFNDNTVKNKENSQGVMITKYAAESGKVYAVKINDTTIQDQRDTNAICKIYVVKKTLPCGTNESKLISIANSKLKRRNKSRKNEDRKTSTTTSTSTPRMGGTFRAMQKRRALHIVDDSHVPDSFMPSIEELY